MLRRLGADELANTPLPSGRVTILFTADWCGACRRFEPAFEARGERDASPFLVVDVSDEESPVWDEYGIEVVPTVAVLEDGRVVRRAGGFLRADDLDRILAGADA